MEFHPAQTSVVFFSGQYIPMDMSSHLQDGTLLDMNGVIIPINGLTHG